MRKFLTALCLLCAFQAAAMYPYVVNFDAKAIKSGTQSWDIIQHRNGWVYFANNYGLLEYDGNRWTTYPVSNYTTVRSLCYDRETDRIYAGAFNEFGYFSRNRAGILEYHSLTGKINSKDADFGEIWQIYRADGTLFFCGANEIFRYKDGQIKRFNFSNKINYAALVHNSFMVAVSNEGVYFMNGDIFMQMPATEVLRDKKICSILPLNNREILFVTAFHGLFKYDGKTLTEFKTDIDDFLIKNQIFCAAVRHSKIAFGTVRNGLVVKDLKSNQSIFSNISSGLQNNTILSINFDKQENLWLGLDKGIDYVVINSPIYSLLGSSKICGSGYASLVKDKTLYLGTNQGLYSTDYPLKNTASLPNVKPVPQIQGQIWSLSLIDNTVFVAANDGAYTIDGNNINPVKGLAGTWGFKKLRSRAGYILGCSYQGFFILKKERNEWKLQHFVKGFEETGGMFEEDNEGNIWFAHWIKGVFKLSLNEKADNFDKVEAIDTSKGFYTNVNNTLSLIQNEIVFSSDGGFFRYDSDKVLHNEKYEKTFGIYPFSVHLYESPNKDVWAVSKNFLSVAFHQPDNSYKTNQTQFSFLKNKLINGFEHFNFVDKEHIIINTEDGFAWLTTNAPAVSDSVSVSIRKVYLTGERDSVICGYLPIQSYISEIKHKDNSIGFEFAAPDFIENEAVLYSFMLENYDTDWSAFSTKNTKEYTKLPKGTYTFKVKAQNTAGITSAESVYTFTVLPAWYQTTAAFVVYFILLVLLTVLLVIYIRKRLHKNIQKLEEQKDLEIQEIEEEKGKEIENLHKQQLEHNLKHKSRELASSTMNLIRKNEMLLEVSQNLNKTIDDIKARKEPKDVLPHLQRIQNDIKENIEQDDNWKKFEENFDLVYENYLKRLKENYPSLTVNDRKLCAYLKMGLSSKDIAPLLNVTYRSVEMGRYHLRKKLNLSHDDNLIKFLQDY
ncbi:MAG: hypothetical protein LBN27_06005 [Prevotellaceae bacterium]|jgi:ligand-binding sensor domain-containing protein/DNA-binding CsgD family transcriptional regulator|nr:hypothetical protein [Prevotellaceae bacterium]